MRLDAVKRLVPIRLRRAVRGGRERLPLLLEPVDYGQLKKYGLQADRIIYGSGQQDVVLVSRSPVLEPHA